MEENGYKNCFFLSTKKLQVGHNQRSELYLFELLLAFLFLFLLTILLDLSYF